MGSSALAYYNEIDPLAAEGLRELIACGLIPDGHVDERSIEDVRAEDLRPFRQCHFFAGIGGWPLALRAAGWPDELAVWTGSCPCQPFSAAGKREGTADRRHLWPAFGRLVAELRPGVVFGEQVASKDALAWLDAVHADLEAEGYAVGAVDCPAAGFGAPHIRQRLYWVADSAGRGLQQQPDARSSGVLHGSHGKEECVQQLGTDCPSDVRMADSLPAGRTEGRTFAGCGSASGLRGACGLALADDAERGADLAGRHDADGNPPGRVEGDGEPGERRETGRVGNASGERGDGRERSAPEGGWDLRFTEPVQGIETGWLADADGFDGDDGRRGTGDDGGKRGEAELRGGEDALLRPGPTNGFWKAADWLFCRDSKWRPVEPQTFPLAPRLLTRVLRGVRTGLLKGAGNAICVPQATEFVRAYMDVAADRPKEGACL